MFLIFVVYTNPGKFFSNKNFQICNTIHYGLELLNGRVGQELHSNGTVTSQILRSKHSNIPYPLYPPSAGVGSSKKLARRHASENLLARMEEEGMNTDPSLIKPKRKVCTCTSLCLGHNLWILILSVFYLL